jgi:O-antigen/teichoic acid export membrane protein
MFIYLTLHNVLLVYDRMRLEALIMAGAVMLNIGLNLFLIPRYGLTGAASATVAAQGLTVVAGLIVVNRLGIRLSLWPLTRIFLAAAVMGLALLAVGPDRLGLAGSIVLGTVIYVLCAIVFRSIPQDLKPQFHNLGLAVKRRRDIFRRTLP